VSRGLNKVMIIGHLGRIQRCGIRPPVARSRLSLLRPIERGILRDGERHSETEWFNVVTWGNLAEICKQFLTKSQQVYIEGRLQTRRWEDAEGVKHSNVEIVASEMMMLGDKHENGQQSPTEASEPEIPTEEEYPF